MRPDGYKIPYVEGAVSQSQLAQASRDGAIFPEQDTYLTSLGMEMLDALESRKLTLANYAMSQMGLQYISPVYGHFMTQFGRTVTSLVQSPARCSDIFEQPVDVVCERLADLPEFGHPLVDTHFTVLRQIGRRAMSHEDWATDIPVLDTEIRHDSLASCHFAESNYVRAACHDLLSVHSISLKKFLHKEVGDPSYINLEPLTYNGINIPSGWIFAHATKKNLIGRGNLYPIRPSLFMHSIHDTFSASTDVFSHVDITKFLALQGEIKELIHTPVDELLPARRKKRAFQSRLSAAYKDSGSQRLKARLKGAILIKT